MKMRMREYTVRELIAEIQRHAKAMPSGMDCKVLVGDIENNHADAHLLQIQSDLELDAVEILCDPDEVS